MKLHGRKSLALALCLAVVLSLTACTPKPAAPSATPAPTGAADGTYETIAPGRNGDIKVATTFSAGKISKVEVLAHSETAGIADTALEQIPANIVAANSLKVDSISGATITGAAIVAAVESAVLQAGGKVEDYSAAAERPVLATETMECDIAVVGAGASGISAAVAAADAGAKVILVEKTAALGGASNLSWAGKFINSSASVADGLVVDEEAMISDWIRDCHWRVDAAAIRQYVTKSGETYDWLADHGYQTLYMNFFGEPLHMLPTDYASREGLFQNMLEKSVIAGGGSVLTQCTAQTLTTDSAGAVTGLTAQRADGTPVEISAGAVIMATGGYAGNAEMVADSFGFEGVLGGLGQNVGEGLEMVWAVGGKVPDNFGGQMLHQTLAPATAGLRKQFTPFQASYPVMLTYVPSLMNVSPSGARFRDETATLEAVAAANTSAFNGAYHYVIVSQAQMDALAQTGMNSLKIPRLPAMPPEFYFDFKDVFTLENPWTDVNAVFDAMVADGTGFKGNTPEELAKAAGMDVDTFTAEFAAYQAACQTGVDTAFNKSADYLLPMGEGGPYYAITAQINNLGSIGGMLVNPKFQVLNEERVGIPGLYAVGAESEGVLFNDTYVGNGVGMGYAFTSGRLGGEYAFASLKK